MPDLPLNRPLSDSEADEFRVLGLSPGHWIALAPIPLFIVDLHLPFPNDIPSLHALQQPLRFEVVPENDPDRAAETEGFWKVLCRQSVRPETIEAGLGLFSWFLATRLQRLQRELYFVALEGVARRYRKIPRPGDSPPSAAVAVRQHLERYLPHIDYVRYPGDPVVVPPTPLDVAAALGPDAWKQTLVAPIAAAMADQQARPGAAASLVADLAHVTQPSPYNSAHPLEPHLSAGGWRRFFVGLLDPVRRDETGPAIDAGMRVAATGLASMSFVTRESLLKTIHEQIVRGIDRADARIITADEWLNRLRESIEDVLGQAEPITLPPPPPLPMPETPPPSINDISSPGTAADASPSAAVAPPDTMKAMPAVIPIEPAVQFGPVGMPCLSPAPSLPKTAVTVERADPFTMVTMDSALALARETTVADIRSWLRSPQPLLFDDVRTECPDVAIVRASERVPPTLWLIGDIHADVLTLANIIAHAERTGEAEGVPPAYVFLGDFVDRGRHDHETLLLLFRLILKDPSRVCVIPGNHDVDLQWDEKGNRFRVTIEPAEYCEELNKLVRSDNPDARERVDLARLAIGFWQSRPKALFLPDGTLLAHAGFPHVDMQPQLQTPADLAKPQCLSDFLWARIAETARKRPNRGNRGHEFGWDTFNQFCKAMARMGVAVERFVRGHDHVAERWQTYPDYAEHPVLTINAMGRRMDGETEPGVGRHPLPVMARHVPGQLPAVVRLPLDPGDVDRVFGKEERSVEGGASGFRGSSTPG